MGQSAIAPEVSPTSPRKSCCLDGHRMRGLSAEARKGAIVAGLVDFAIVIVVPSAVIAAIDFRHWLLMVERWHPIVMVLGPVALIAGWRGARHTALVAPRGPQWARAAVEGFVVGFGLVLLTVRAPLVGEAFAAGSGFEGFDFQSVSEWLRFLRFAFPFALGGGLAGSAVALGLAALNLRVLRWYRAI